MLIVITGLSACLALIHPLCISSVFLIKTHHLARVFSVQRKTLQWKRRPAWKILKARAKNTVLKKKKSCLLGLLFVYRLFVCL